MDIDLSPKAAEIVASARKLLATRGYNGFSYADISATVGISKPSVHHHFPSKAELVRRVVAGYVRDADAGLASLDSKRHDPLAQLRAYTGYWQACLREQPTAFCLCAMLATEMPVLPAEVAAEVRAHFSALSAWVAGVLRRGAAAGVLQLHAAPATEALAFMAAIHGAMVSARAFGDPEVFGTIANALVKRLVPA